MNNTSNRQSNQITIKISIVLTITMALGLAVIFPNLQPQIPLFYTLALPSQALAAKEYLFLIPAISLIIFGLHFLIYKKLASFPINPVIWKLLWSVTILIQSLLAISLARIIWITI